MTNILYTNPDVITYPKLRSEFWCMEFIEQYKHLLEPSTTINIETGDRQLNDYRQSMHTSLSRGLTQIQVLQDDIARLTGIPTSMMEDPQLTYYPVGGYYKPHYDYFFPDFEGTKQYIRNHGQRIATFILYLNDVQEGGNTNFVNIGIQIKPSVGKGLFFRNVSPGGQLLRKSMHSGEPVVKGEKYILTTWMYDRNWSE